MTNSWKTPLFIVVASCAIVALSFYIVRLFQNPPVPQSSQTPPITQVSERDQVVARAAAVAHALVAKDPKQLATLVHPIDGVRFSLYGQISAAHDKKFSAAQIMQYFDTNVKFTWGVQDGSGATIVMPLKTFVDKEFADHDYDHATEISYDVFKNRGNAISNVDGFYPGSHTVEFYFPGFNPNFGGMDWRSIQIVMSKYQGEWYVIDVVSNRWTI